MLDLSQIGRTKVGAAPTLSSLHHDREKREEQLKSAQTLPGPENRARRSETQLQVETAAATAAALIGSFFSSNPNVTIGPALPFNENLLVQNSQAVPRATVDTKPEQPPGACLLLLSTRPKSCDKPTAL